jgi:MFS transporter, FSR family, fosmidomycin resistance protein
MSASLSIDRGQAAQRVAVSVILALSFSHFLNDMMQSLVPALYPMLKAAHGLSFTQIGLITLTMQLTSSLVQPTVGLMMDRRPQPYSLAAGMGVTLVGLLMLARAEHYLPLLLAAALVGVGSAVFHPEASRVARLASGGRHGLAQSLFQVGGNVGSSLGPLLAAFIVIPKGQGSIAWFSSTALLAMTVLFVVAGWHRREQSAPVRPHHAAAPVIDLSPRQIAWAMTILLIVVFSKSFYTTSLYSYYTFYLISKFHVTLESAQLHLFAFLASVALGTLVGGPLGDRIGRKYVLWGSIVGVLPFTLLLPHVGLFWTGILTAIIGMTMASASSTIVVYAIDLMPGNVGTVAGLFFGLSFGLAGVGAAALGKLADATSIATVYQLCAFLPAIGLLTVFLPNVGRPVRPRPEPAAAPVRGSANA